MEVSIAITQLKNLKLCYNNLINILKVCPTWEIQNNLIKSIVLNLA